MRISLTRDNMKIFESLASPTRIAILESLSAGAKNVGELAKQLNISSAITTRHINMLEEAGLVFSENVPGKRGIQKVCSIAVDDINIYIEKEKSTRQFTSISIPVGQYIDFDIKPTCGLASVQQLIGICDDPRYFSDPMHVKASLLWFKTGWISYRIPSYIINKQPIQSIELSLEICSEFPGFKEDWPSDIHFYLNDVFIGYWTSPGDFGSKHGVYTPDWYRFGSQHGLLKTIRITENECMLDGIQLSDLTLKDIPIQYGKDLIFRIEIPAEANNAGGINIFGKGFGNYDQDIEVCIEY